MRAISGVILSIATLSLGACASGPRVKKADFPEIDVAKVSGCDRPSMQFNELRDERARPVSSDSMPVRVRPGVYSIALECAWSHNTEGACINTHGNPELLVPPYALILNPKIRYVFSCDLEGKEYVIRMEEKVNGE